MKRIVIAGEGHGEVNSAYRAVSKVLTAADYSSVFVDQNVIRTGEVGGLLKNDCEKWRRLLRYVQSKGDVGGVVLLLDGDVCKECPVEVATVLANAALPIASSGKLSVCAVFALQEYESWLLSGLVKGAILADGRKVAPSDPDVDYEKVRGSKERLRKLVQGSYRPTRDQLLVTDAANWNIVKEKSRSYRRLCSAVRQIVDSVNSETFVVTPRSNSAS